MTKTTTTVAGTNETRTSFRTYTHAIVADFDAAAAKAHAEKDAEDCVRLNWEYHQNCAAAVAGQNYGRGFNFTIDADMIERSKAAIAGGLDAAIARAFAKVAITVADGQVIVLQWSQSERNAVKGMGRFGYRRDIRNIRVVETTVI